MKNLVLSAIAILFFIGCGNAVDTEPADAQGPTGSDADLEAALAQAEASADDRSDAISRCGEDTCSPFLCGYDCTTSGEQCKRACAEVDSRPDTTVKLDISGAVSTSVDSTKLGYNPVLRLHDVLIYGCDVWDFSNGERNGLEILYNELMVGAFELGDPEIAGRRVQIYIPTFEGPGSYLADGSFRPESGAKVTYGGADVCGVEIRADQHNGIIGTIICDSIPARQDSTTVSMRGEFACGMNATDYLQFTDLTPDN